MRSFWAGRRANLVLDFHGRRRQYRITDRGGYESRNAATTHLLIEALQQCKGELSRSFSLPIFTDDFVRRPPRVPHFAYCADDRPGHAIAIPDFFFWSWPEVGVSDYEATADAMLAAGDRPFDDPRLFWIGNPTTHPTRERFLETAARDARIKGVSVKWLKESQSVAPMKTVGDRYVSLPDHCRYRYLLDLEGRGYSARVKLLLFSGRPLFLQARRWKEFFYADLVPWVHYIPVCEDLSDLGTQLNWADAHPNESLRIAAGARQFAMTRLRRSHATETLARQLVAVSHRQLPAAFKPSGTSAAPGQS
jgi:hypothetical protein